MSLGHNIRKIAADFNTGLRIYNFTKGLKPSRAVSVLDTSNGGDLPCLEKKFNSLLLCNSSAEKLCFTFPQTNISIKTNIIELPKISNVNFELPVRNSKVTTLDCPLYIEKEISEPVGKVISKKARHIIAIRRRKMRKHKLKKMRKKNKAFILKTTLRKQMAKEAALESNLQNICREAETFSAEKYITETLEKVHWQRPVTRVRGFLAPKWVIKNYLEEEEEKRIFQQRIKDCMK